MNDIKIKNKSLPDIFLCDDDTQILPSKTTVEDQLQDVTNVKYSITEWFANTELSLNLKKT